MKRFLTSSASGYVVVRFKYNALVVETVRSLSGAVWSIDYGGWMLTRSAFSILVDMYGADAFDFGPGVRDLLDPEQTIGYENPTFVIPDFRPYTPTWAALTSAQGYTEHDHQATGSSWLITSEIGMLLDDMGLGKSKQFIDAAAYVARTQRMRVLVVCRASNIDTWVGEVAKFAPFATTYTYRGTKRHLPPILDDFSFTIVSYEVLRKDTATLALRNWDWICLDEGHAIKSSPFNKQSEIARVIHHFDAGRKLIMTGTPMPNNPAELYNQLLWLGIEHRRWADFENDTLIVANVAKKYNGAPIRKIVGYKPLGLRELRAKTARHVIRRTKDEVLNLPPKIRQDEFVTLSPIEARLYSGAERELRLYLNENPNAPFSTIAESAQMVRMKQITSDASIFSDKPFVSSKLQWVRERVEQAVECDTKVIVYSQFRSVIASLTVILEDFNPAVVTGDVSTNATMETKSPRQQQVEKFQNDATCKVFLGTSAACRYGFTLTSASVVLFVDLDWNEDYNVQNEDRAYRIGQTNTVNVYRLFALLPGGTPTFDSNIEQFIAKKQAVTSSMLRKAN